MKNAKDYKIIAQYGEYTLIDRGNEYVVAYRFNDEKMVFISLRIIMGNQKK